TDRRRSCGSRGGERAPPPGPADPTGEPDSHPTRLSAHARGYRSRRFGVLVPTPQPSLASRVRVPPRLSNGPLGKVKRNGAAQPWVEPPISKALARTRAVRPGGLRDRLWLSGCARANEGPCPPTRTSVRK